MNKTFILKSPETGNKLKAQVSVIYVEPDTPFPLDWKTSENLDKLKDFSELFFVFSKSIRQEVLCSKFSSMYSAFGYVEADSDSQVDAIVYALSYLSALYPTNFIWIGYTRMNGISIFENPDFEGIHRAILLPLTSSRVPYTRLRPDEMSPIYMRENRGWLRSFLDSFFPDLSNMFWTHKIEDDTKYFLLRPKLLEDLSEHSIKYPEYVETFITGKRSFGDFLASWIYRYYSENVVCQSIFPE